MDLGCFAKVIDPLTGASNYVAQINCVPALIDVAARTFLIFSGTFSLFLVVWGGIRLITSGGDPKQVAAARQIITYAIIGLIVVLSSFSIIYLVAYLTKTNGCITNPALIITGGCR